MDAHQLWQAALGQLELQLPRPTFETWMQRSHALSLEDGTLVVAVHSAYAKDWLENRLYGRIHRTVSAIAERTIRLRFVVQREHADGQLLTALLDSPAPSNGSVRTAHTAAGEARVNAKYTFESFIVGESNQLAHAACLAVADDPGGAYNPLFVYGGVGLGKTHLLHAIGNRALERGKQALYVPAETFANEMINAIRARTTEEFRARYRTMDVLLLDDTQFLINKERTQEEFFHTFNVLHQDNRQIVLSSDRPPKAFVGLEERLRSRFEWGLTADIRPPDLETRIAILQTKAETLGVRVPDEVLEFVAQQVSSNIRELEGALNRVLAWARMMGRPLTVQTAEKALADVIHLPTQATADDILRAVAAYFGLRVEDLTGSRRPRSIAMPRQIAMYLIRELTPLSLPQIGQVLGGRDHTTVMYGCDKLAALFEKDDAVRRQVLELKTGLAGARAAQPQGERTPARGAR
ncbi:MAG: chromosomal replication initiator protein DnaA [Chloroflexota bacterium]